MAEHRVPMLGDAWRRRVDPAKSRDPQVRELVAALATLEVAPAPSGEFRAELRAQLVAVTPRLVEEGKAEVAAEAATASPKRAPRRHRASVKKPLLVLGGVMAAFIVLLGGAVLLSQDALPGDALYGVKRASENTQYSLTGGTVDKGNLKLDFAGRRIDEVSQLLPRASAMAAGQGALADNGQVNSETAKLVRETLASADDDVRDAAQMLGGAAVRGDSAGPLDDITNWSPEQIAKMTAVVARVPTADPLHARAINTLNLIKRADARAAALKTDLGCGCLESSGTDELGPIPCHTGCSGNPTTRPTNSPGRPGSTSGSSRPTVPVLPGKTSTTPAGGSTKTTTPAQGGGHSSSTPRQGKPSPSQPPDSGGGGLPTLPVPTLPVGVGTTPTLPVGVDSCGVHATLGPIGISIGPC